MSAWCIFGLIVIGGAIIAGLFIAIAILIEDERNDWS